MPYVPPRYRSRPPCPVAPLAPPEPAPPRAAKPPKPAAPVAPQPATGKIVRRERSRSGPQMDRIDLNSFEPDPHEVVAALFGY